jgi:hypothetical protein
MGSAWPWVSVLQRQSCPIVQQRQDRRSAPPTRVKSLSIRLRRRTLAAAAVSWGIYSHRGLLWNISEVCITFAIQDNTVCR